MSVKFLYGEKKISSPMSQLADRDVEMTLLIAEVALIRSPIALVLAKQLRKCRPIKVYGDQAFEKNGFYAKCQ